MVRRCALALILLASACAAPPPPAAPPEQPGPATSPSERLASLERSLASSEQQLDRELAARTPLASGAAERGGAEQTAVPASNEEQPRAEAAPPAKAEKAPRAGAPAENKPAASAVSSCDLACRALASMRRSANGICELVGQADARCARARSRVAEAEKRLDRAGCACTASAP